MGDIVSLRGFPIPLDTPLGQNFIVDVARASEGLMSDDEIQAKYELTPEAWRNSTKDKTLVHAVQAERDRRMLNGAAAREAAARHFVKAPAILNGIMSDAYSNPRHKIEAIKELRQTAIGDNADRPMEADKFIIHIDLGGGHVETYDKELAPMKPVNSREHDGEE